MVLLHMVRIFHHDAYLSISDDTANNLANGDAEWIR